MMTERHTTTVSTTMPLRRCVSSVEPPEAHMYILHVTYIECPIYYSYVPANTFKIFNRKIIKVLYIIRNKIKIFNLLFQFSYCWKLQITSFIHETNKNEYVYNTYNPEI